VSIGIQSSQIEVDVGTLVSLLPAAGIADPKAQGSGIEDSIHDIAAFDRNLVGQGDEFLAVQFAPLCLKRRESAATLIMVNHAGKSLWRQFVGTVIVRPDVDFRPDAPATHGSTDFY